MAEILEIRHFGAIANVRLELKRFNVIIGENATGKSSVAKVLAVCRYFSYIIETRPFYLDTSFMDGLVAWGLAEYLTKDTQIYYECENYSVKAEYVETKAYRSLPDSEEFEEYYEPVFRAFVTPLSEKFSELLRELEELKKSRKAQFNLPIKFFGMQVKSVMDNPFYLPTERGLQSIFSLGRNSIQNISDSLFNQFARLDQIARNFSNETDIEPLAIQYKNENGRGFIKKGLKDKYLSLFYAASGYQSTIPIVLVVKYYAEVYKKAKTIIIEEPELNLFPSAQYSLVKFLVQKCINESDCSLLLTTHSPYVLKTINCLIYAYWIGLVYKDKIGGVVGEEFWLNPDEVSAYKLTENGEIVNIFDEITKQIDVLELDSISDIIQAKWNSIEGFDDLFK